MELMGGGSYLLPTVTRDSQVKGQLKMERGHEAEEKKRKLEAKGKARKCSWFAISIGSMAADVEERNTNKSKGKIREFQ